MNSPNDVISHFFASLGFLFSQLFTRSVLMATLSQSSSNACRTTQNTCRGLKNGEKTFIQSQYLCSPPDCDSDYCPTWISNGAELLFQPRVQY